MIVVLGVLGLGVVGEGWLLKNAYEKQGALQTSLNTATARLKEINDVHKEMDKVHGTNNAKSDDDLFNGLLPAAPGR